VGWKGLFGTRENLMICWCVIIVQITGTFHTDEILLSKAVGKCNVTFHIVHFMNVVGMWVMSLFPQLRQAGRDYLGLVKILRFVGV
jgi:hypothetical protein